MFAIVASVTGYEPCGRMIDVCRTGTAADRRAEGGTRDHSGELEIVYSELGRLKSDMTSKKGAVREASDDLRRAKARVSACHSCSRPAIGIDYRGRCCGGDQCAQATFPRAGCSPVYGLFPHQHARPDLPQQYGRRRLTMHSKTDDTLELLAAARCGAEAAWRDGLAYQGRGHAG